jgi:hypothetical protein
LNYATEWHSLDGNWMRIFSTRVFAKFVKKQKIRDASLLKAIVEAEAGVIQADLGGGLIKQWLARPGSGKSGGFRLVIAYRKGSLAVFLVGFAKSEQANLTDAQLKTLLITADAILSLSDDEIDRAVAAGALTEVAL